MIAPIIRSIGQKLIHWSSKILSRRSLHSGRSGITCNNVVQPIMSHNLKGKYTSDPTIYATTFGLVRKILHRRPRWSGICSHHPSREEDWVWLIPSHNPKQYSPNLWCEDFNQWMTTRKCYCEYALPTLHHERGQFGPSDRMDSKHGSQTEFLTPIWG